MGLACVAGMVYLDGNRLPLPHFWPESQICEFTKSQIRRMDVPFYSLPTEARAIVYNAPDACSVRVHEEPLRYATTGRQVIVDLEDGHEVLVTTFCTMDDPKSHRDVAQRIASFLDVPFFEAAAAVEGAAAEQPEPPR